MRFFQQPWIRYALLSLLIHAAILSIALQLKIQEKAETIEVSLVMEDSAFQPAERENSEEMADRRRDLPGERVARTERRAKPEQQKPLHEPPQEIQRV